MAAQNGGGLKFQWIFVGPFSPFSGLPDSTQVPLMLEQLRRSGLLQAVRESSPVAFLDGKWSIREAMKMGEFFDRLFDPKFQKVIKMAVPNGVIGTKYIL